MVTGPWFTSSTSIISWKRPVSQRRPRARMLGDEVFVEFAGALGTGGCVERRPLALPDVPKQSELRDGENRAADVGDAAVHLSFLIFKNAQAGDFRGEIIGVGFGVFVRYSQQYQQSLLNFSREFSIDLDRGAAHALDDGTHRWVVSQPEDLPSLRDSGRRWHRTQHSACGYVLG